MTAGWVAASVRARALARRRVGSEAARGIARAPSLHDAIETLADGPYGRDIRDIRNIRDTGDTGDTGDIRPGQSPAEAQHAVAATLLWHLRVLAGWLPRGGTAMLRTLAGWFEIANTDELLAGLMGGVQGRTFSLGALAAAWPRLQAAGSFADLRAALAISAWNDPGGEEPRTIQLGMRASWAARVAALPDPAPSWAAAASALLLAGERFVAGRDVPGFARARIAEIIGAAPVRAVTFDDFASTLPTRARWVIPPGTEPADLWQAEARWWARLERDGFGLLASSTFDSGPLLGTSAVLATDAWRLRAALEMAARGGQPLEAYDAVAYDAVPYDLRDGAL